ncbi:uncharacterized protein LOC144130308 isoform X1 [Amblyomma americanum]
MPCFRNLGWGLRKSQQFSEEEIRPETRTSGLCRVSENLYSMSRNRRASLERLPDRPNGRRPGLRFAGDGKSCGATPPSKRVSTAGATCRIPPCGSFSRGVTTMGSLSRAAPPRARMRGSTPRPA